MRSSNSSKLNFTASQGNPHPFQSLFISKARTQSKEWTAQTWRRASHDLFPRFTEWFQALVDEVPEGFIKQPFEEPVVGKRLILSGELPYHQPKYLDSSAVLTSLHSWAGCEPNLYLMMSKDEYSLTQLSLAEENQVAMAGLVLQDLSNYGLSQINRDTEHKAIYLKGLLSTRKYLKVSESSELTYIRFQFSNTEHALKVWNLLKEKDIITDLDEDMIGVANYPLHSKEAFYQLIDALEMILPPNEGFDN